MATAEKYLLADGKTVRWRARYRTPDRRSAEKAGFTAKRAAINYGTEVESSKLRGEYVRPADGNITIGDLGPGWLARQSHLKPSSLRPLQIAWRIHVEPRWGRVRLSDIRYTEAQQWIAELSAKRGASVVIRTYGILAAILDDAVKDRRLSSNPVRGIPMPRKMRKPHTYLTHLQVFELAKAAGGNRALILTLAYTGIRWGEAAGLRVKDLDLLRRQATISQNAVNVGGQLIVGTPKSHRARTVPVAAVLVEHLARQCEGKDRDDLVFPAPKGGHLKAPNGTRGWFEKARIHAGLPRLTPHDLRHTAASLAVSSGAQVKVIQRMLGHASAAMTLDVYADLFTDDLTEVGDRMSSAARAATEGFSWGVAT
jgi:integrase